MKLNKLLLVFVLLVVVLMTGCNFTYVYDQDIENIESVEIMRYDYETKSTSPIIVLDDETAMALLNDITAMGCSRHFMDPPTHYGYIIVYITYENGEAEVIGGPNCARVDKNGNWHRTGDTFGAYEYSKLICKYVDEDLVPELVEILESYED